MSPRSPVPGETNAQVSITWPSTDPNGPPITKYDVFRRTGGGAWNLIATRSGGDSRVASDTIPYQGQTVEYVVTATNGGPATSDKANYQLLRPTAYPRPATMPAVTTRTPTTRPSSATRSGQRTARAATTGSTGAPAAAATGVALLGRAAPDGTAGNLGSDRRR